MTGPTMRSTPVTGPATSTSNHPPTSAASYASTASIYPSTPAASYASTASTYPSTPATSYASTAPTYPSTPATSYASPASTPAASYAPTQASPPASTPSSTAAAAQTGDYVSAEQHRYVLTNFVRTSIQKYPFTIPTDSSSDSPYGFGFRIFRIRLGHCPSEGRGTAVPARRAGAADRTAPSTDSSARGFIILQPIRRGRACRRRKFRR
jgi:hypothetical protein